MKKLLSTIAAIAMLVASFATTSFAAVTNETPAKLAGSLTKIDVASEDYTNNYADLCQEYVDMGLDLYSLKLSVVNSPASVTYKSMGSKYTGSTIAFFSAQLAVTTDAILDEEYCYISKTGAAIPGETTLKYAEGDGSAPIDAVVKKSLTAGSTVDLVETIVAIVPEKTFSVDVIAAEVGTADFAGTVAGQPTADSYAGYILGAADGLMVMDASLANGLTTAEKEDEGTTYGAVVEMAAPGVFSALKGVEVTATNSDNVTGSVVKSKADIFGSLDSLTAATVELALNINNVPAGQALSNVTMAWAY